MTNGRLARTFLKTLDDALRLRNSLLAAFELAENRSDEIEIGRLLTFVVVGGGPTGVELAGAIAELAHSTLRATSVTSNRPRRVSCSVKRVQRYYQGSLPHSPIMRNGSWKTFTSRS